jgi:hypothetical protein
MKDLASLVVRQFRVFEPDVIPAAALLTGPGREVFRAQFNFREIVIPENAPGDLHFAGGMLITPGNDNPIIINYAQINPQRIILDVAGDTATTYIIYEAISAAIAQLDPRSRLRESEPLLLTHETQCVARLSIKWQDLVSDRLAHFLESESVVNIKSGPAASRIASMTLRFVIQFDPFRQKAS